MEVPINETLRTGVVELIHRKTVEKHLFTTIKKADGTSSEK